MHVPSGTWRGNLLWPMGREGHLEIYLSISKFGDFCYIIKAEKSEIDFNLLQQGVANLDAQANFERPIQ